jgi:hypothetical protein
LTTTARTEQLDALRCLPEGEAARILQWALVEQRSTCEIAKLLGIGELDAEARYQQALVDLQRRRRQDVDGMVLVWDARDRTGKARFGGVSIELDRAPDIGIAHLRRLDILPGRIAELRVSGHGTRRLSPLEHEHAIAWLRNLANTLRAAAAPLLATEQPPMTAPMPLTDWPALEVPTNRSPR